jgi:hypothetical protein
MPAVSGLTVLAQLTMRLSFFSFLLDMQDIEVRIRKSYEVGLVGKSYGW